VALQEVPIATAPEVVDELLGPGLHVRGFTRAAKDGVGAALATRWPHRVVEEIDQRCSPRSLEFDWCATLLGELDASIGRTLFAHHKPSWQFGYEWEREQQALAAAGSWSVTSSAFAIRTRGKPCGRPSRLHPENPLVRAARSRPAVSRHIDYVLIRCGVYGPTLQVQSCGRLLDRVVEGVWASDHFGVVADLAVPDHPPGSWARAGDPRRRCRDLLRLP